MGAAVPRAAADRRRPGAGARCSPSSTPSWPRSASRSPTATRSRAWRRWRPSSSTTCSCSSTSCPATPSSWSATPSGCAPARTTWSRTTQEFLEASWATAATGGKAPVDLGASAYKTLVEVREHATAHGHPWWTIIAVPRRRGARGQRRRPRRPGPAGLPGRDRAAPSTTSAAGSAEGWPVLLMTQGHGTGRAHWSRCSRAPTSRSAASTARPEPGVASRDRPAASTPASSSDLLKTLVLTEGDLTGARGAGPKDISKRMPSRPQERRGPLAAQAVDPVVHEQHGVGRYVEMVQRTVAGATREYLILEYAKGDRLFVPTDQLEHVTRYVGGEAPSPRPARRRPTGPSARAGPRRRSARSPPGSSSSTPPAPARPATPSATDTPWQRELEDAFPYVETPDQLEAIDEVKADMEKPIPMDRVICGDVGYGKTEIAVRAAFKAVQDGKQVAILVPTTLLVQQHFNTFRDRFAQFPVTVRATLPLQLRQGAAEVLARHRPTAAIDVVIGTHRLLSQVGAVQGPRPRDRRRGAALRRRAQGVPQVRCARRWTC